MRLAVIGAGGYSKEVADLIVACDHELVGFVDESYTGRHSSTGLPVVACLESLSCDGVVLAIGDGAARSRWYERLRGVKSIPTLIHPTAVVSPAAVVGLGVQVMQFVVLNADAAVGDDCILNVGACVAHDCTVGAHSHIAPGVQLGGGSSIGRGCLVGTSATVLPGVSVGNACTLGAGAVLVSDLTDGVTAVGIPARAPGSAGSARERVSLGE